MKRKAILWVAAVLVVGGCSKEEVKTVAELGARSAQVRDEAVKARKEADAKTADRLSVTLAELHERRNALQPTTVPADQAVWEKSAADLAAASKQIRLARDEALRKEIRGSLKVRAYRAGRGVLIPGLFHGMALAAEQTATTQVASMAPSLVSTSAQLGQSVVEICEHGFEDPAATSQPTQIAADTPARLRALAKNPPVRIGLLLASGWLVTGQNRLAWVEAEQCEPGLSQVELLVARLIRGWAMSNDGMGALAADELEQALAAGGIEGVNAQEQLGCIHFLLAAIHAREKQFGDADREFVAAMQAWPDCPAVVFVTGERLAADGQYEKAAESLEAMAKGTKYLWLAEMLSARAKEIRDGKGEAKPLIADPKFVVELMIRGLMETGKTTMAEQLAKWRDAAMGAAGAAGSPAGGGTDVEKK